MLNFLNRNSASKDYSSRAAGAAKAVFDKAPDKFLEFHKKLFEPGTQPQEGSSTDPSNDDLAKIAEQVGAGAAAADIRSGADVQAAAGSAKAAILQLAKITGNIATPTIVKDGKPVQWQDPQWLATLLGTSAPAQAQAPAPAPTS
jgi:protein-disulfide isomerase